MKFYERLMDSEDNPKHKKYSSANIIIDESTLGFNRYDTDSGKPLTNWNEYIKAEYVYKKSSPATDYVSNDLAWFLVRERLKSLLISLDISGIEYYSLKLKCTNRPEENLTVYLVNILTIVNSDAIDLSCSKYSYLDDEKTLLTVMEYCLKDISLHCCQNFWKLETFKLQFAQAKNHKKSA